VEMLKLLFQSIRAIIKPNIDNELIRVVFEMKALCVNGEFPGIPRDRNILSGTKYTMDFISSTPVEKLYNFAVKDEVLAELKDISRTYCKTYMDKKFKSLELIETLTNS